MPEMEGAFGAIPGGQKVQVSDNELEQVIAQLNTIIEELDVNLNRSIKIIEANEFYIAGEAKKAAEKLVEANTKFLELHDHYTRLATVVEFNLEKIKKTDVDLKNNFIES